MISSTEGIVLRQIKYSESSIIVTVYTHQFGRQSYIVHKARSKKSKNKSVFFQPLHLVEITAQHRENKNLQTLRSVKPTSVYQNIPFDIEKSTQTIFIAEILYKVLKEQEQNIELFDFIKNAILFFDLMDIGQNNFHIYFLLKLTGYLGLYPQLNGKTDSWLDLQQGKLVTFEPTHPHYTDQSTTKLLMVLSELKFSELDNLHISSMERKNLLNAVLTYYRLHFENFGELKSLKVLKELFL